MTLRRQLLLVSLLLLALPWAGCEFLRETENVMRLGQQQSLQTTAKAIAAVLASQSDTLYTYPHRQSGGNDDALSIYAYSTEQEQIVDGYGDGWELIPDSVFRSESSNLRLAVQAQVRGAELYLLLRVFDDQIRYFNPGGGVGNTNRPDRVVLRMGESRAYREYRIATVAPGHIRAAPANRRARSDEARGIQGYWQDAVGGYTVELALPLALTGGRLGIVAIDEPTGSGQAQHAGNFTPGAKTSAPWLIFPSATIKQSLQAFSPHDYRLAVVDRFGWLLFEAPPDTARGSSSSETFWLLRLLYRSILLRETPPPFPGEPRPGKTGGREVSAALAGVTQTLRYTDPLYDTRTLQSTATPVLQGGEIAAAVILRQSGETYLSLTDRAFSRLLNYSLLALGVSVLGLLGYATLLSIRIRKLSRLAGEAIAEDGTVSADFPASKARDEIGDLARHYGRLLQRIRDYQDYLRTLSRKLSHELRTPIAVIQSSLDNMDETSDAADDAGNAEYRRRAREGLARLQHILTAMSEASGLEESIQADSLRPVELVALLTQVWDAYQSVYPGHQLTMTTALTSASTMAVPELIVQALDKLVENAASFTPAGGNIILDLKGEPDAWCISLGNDGPLLPGTGANNVFDPMVSVRDPQSQGVHLGLGLHIVRLIADYHKGELAAKNRADGSGVVFSLKLPRTH